MTELLRVPRILWMGLLAVTVLFCAASAYPLHTVVHPEPMPFVLAPCLWVVGVADAVLGFVIPGMQRRRFVASLVGKVTTEREENADVLYRQLAPEIRVLRVGRGMLRRIVLVSQTLLVLGCAMSVSIAIFGLVLAVLGFWPVWSAPLGVAGVVLVALRFPSERSFLQPIEKALKARIVIDLKT